MKDFLHLVPTVIHEYEDLDGVRIYQTEDGQHLKADEFDEQILPKKKKNARFTDLFPNTAPKNKQP